VVAEVAPVSLSLALALSDQLVAVAVVPFTVTRPVKAEAVRQG
jgi:hypothetical protein